MAITLQTYINHNLWAIQEQLDDIHKMDTTSYVLCRKTAEELGISVSTLNNGYIKLRDTILKHMSKKQNEKSRTRESKTYTYGMVQNGENWLIYDLCL